MDDYEEKTLLLAFKWRERDVQLRANWQGYANTWLRENPWSSRRHYGEREWEMRALEMGRVAVNSILRDWVKGQVTAIETGILTFEHVFMPYMMLPDGRSLGEHATKLLEGPQS
ncbi:MAG: hypothetical protein GY906_24160 [bacterium]|nr:hypothetical protein [bacterium]